MNSILLQILKKKGLTFDQLRHDERQTFIEWQRVLEAKDPDVTQLLALIDQEIAKVSEAIIAMQIKENSLIEGPTTELVYLGARLENLKLMASFIRSPREAVAKMEESLARQFKLA